MTCKRYEEFLKIDFPRFPLPSDLEKFKNISELGKELVELHLLKHPSLSEPEIGFPVSGSNTVEKVRYDEENRRVYFNKAQYFSGISKAVWEYQIGGYQVLAKYLKDRQKRELSREEIEHYIKVAKTEAIYTSIVASPHPVDKKDFRFLSEFPNHKIQISNNIYNLFVIWCLSFGIF